MLGKRHHFNPLITPQDIKPSCNDFEVIGVFNAGATIYQNEVILLLRVAERPKPEKGWIHIPILDLAAISKSNKYPIKIISFHKDKSGLETSDPRAIYDEWKLYLTSISHFRLARSKDGMHFQIAAEPTIYPQNAYETYGIEDPRITKIDNIYYITYVAVSEAGICTALLSTKNWQKYYRHGIIFHPMNKDVVIFPKKINDVYVALHRPDAAPCTKPSIWLAFSPDLIHWGKHQLLLQPRETKWDAERIGAGAPPILTKHGWLEIYHGVSKKYGYSLGALLLDKNHPGKIIARSPKPILFPQEDYEKNGFFANTVFTNGIVQWPDEPDVIHIYYGAGDTYICHVAVSLQEIFRSLR
ncbi:MAG: glycoside hydrolase family 130 protein [bacterium]|nr:glycoside hydrolase family 130 protein [bacterium]